MANPRKLKEALRKRAARQPAAEARLALRLAGAAEERAAQFEAMGQRAGATALRAYARMGRKIAPWLALKAPQLDMRLLTDLAVCLYVAESLHACGKPSYAKVTERLNDIPYFKGVSEESVKRTARRYAGVVSYFAGTGPQPGREAQAVSHFLARVHRSLPEAHPLRVKMRRLVAAMKPLTGDRKSLPRADFITAATVRE